MKSILSFLGKLLSKPVVRHGLQTAFTVAAASVAAGKLDLSPVLNLIGR